MSNDKAVEDLLGKEFVSKILDHASEGMEEADLKQIARKLGEMSDPPNKVLGGHKIRMNSKNVHHRVEMKAILSDFWNEKLYDLTPEEGRDALIKIFESPDLVGDGNMNLSKKLQELHSYPNLPATTPTVPVLPAGALTPEKMEKAVMKAIIKPSDPEFAENLAYDVGKQFGDNFKIWLSEDRNRNKGTEAKARQWVEMWKAHLGEDANLHKLIAILELRNDSKDCVAQLKKTQA